MFDFSPYAFDRVLERQTERLHFAFRQFCCLSVVLEQCRVDERLFYLKLMVLLPVLKISFDITSRAFSTPIVLPFEHSFPRCRHMRETSLRTSFSRGAANVLVRMSTPIERDSYSSTLITSFWLLSLINLSLIVICFALTALSSPWISFIAGLLSRASPSAQPRADQSPSRSFSPKDQLLPVKLARTRLSS